MLPATVGLDTAVRAVVRVLTRAGSSKSGGGPPQAACFAVLAGGLKRPLREAPPLIVAAGADCCEKRLPLRAALKHQGALVRATDNEWRAKLWR